MATGAVLWQRSEFDFDPSTATDNERNVRFVPSVVQAERGQRREPVVQHLSQLRFNLSVPPRSENLTTRFTAPKAIFLERVPRGYANQRGRPSVSTQSPQPSVLSLERLEQASLLARHDLRHGHAALSVESVDAIPPSSNVANATPVSTGTAAPTRALSTRNPEHVPPRVVVDYMSPKGKDAVSVERSQFHAVRSRTLTSATAQKAHRDDLVSARTAADRRPQEPSSKTIRVDNALVKRQPANNPKSKSVSNQPVKSAHSQKIEAEVAALHRRLRALVEQIESLTESRSVQTGQKVAKPTHTVQSRLHGGQVEIEEDSDVFAARGHAYAVRLARTFYAIQQKVRHLSADMDRPTAPASQHAKKTEALHRLATTHRSAVRALEELLRQHYRFAVLGQSKAWQRQLAELLHEFTLCCGRLQVAGVDSVSVPLTALLLEREAAAESSGTVARPSLHHRREPSPREKVEQWQSEMDYLPKDQPEIPAQMVRRQPKIKKVKRVTQSVHLSARQPQAKLQFAQSAVQSSCRSRRCIAHQTVSSLIRKEIIRRQREALSKHIHHEAKIQQKIALASEQERRLASPERRHKEMVGERRTTRKRSPRSKRQETAKVEKDYGSLSESDLSLEGGPPPSGEERVVGAFHQSLAQREIQRQLWLEETSKQQMTEIERLHKAHQDDLAALQAEISHVRELALQQRSDNCDDDVNGVLGGDSNGPRQAGSRGDRKHSRRTGSRRATSLVDEVDSEDAQRARCVRIAQPATEQLEEEEEDDDNSSLFEEDTSSVSSAMSTVTLRCLLKKLERIEDEQLDICKRWRHVVYPDLSEHIPESNALKAVNQTAASPAGPQISPLSTSRSVTELQMTVAKGTSASKSSLNDHLSLEFSQEATSQSIPYFPTIASGLVPADVPVNMLGGIQANRKRFSNFASRSSCLYGDSRRAVIESVSEALLDDLVSDVVRELEQICDQTAEHVYEHEFKVAE